MDEEDNERYKLETARNQLESYIYKCKELSWEDDIEDFTKPDELSQLKELSSELSEWLEDHMDSGKTQDFVDQKEKLQKVAGPIFFRRSELSQRPVQVENLQTALKATKQIVEFLDSKLNETLISEEEFEKFRKELDGIQRWFEETSEQQSKLQKSDDPVLLISDLKQKVKNLKKLAKAIDPTKRMKPKQKETKKSEKVPEFTEAELENLKKSGLSKEDIEKLLKEIKDKQPKGTPSATSESPEPTENEEYQHPEL
jgi:DNA-binding transcriptional regulator YhcF (GntR family)